MYRPVYFPGLSGDKSPAKALTLKTGFFRVLMSPCTYLTKQNYQTLSHLITKHLPSSDNLEARFCKHTSIVQIPTSLDRSDKQTKRTADSGCYEPYALCA